ncbi:MAG: MFS transporter [Acidobacteriota bacterium]|nr:MFS transporter [Acidobacteriota bacterium]
MTNALARLNRTIFVLAGLHFLVDSYGNIYAPLLPLLIPRLHFSLAIAGTLTMCYQIAASMSQLGFGHLADHWKPRVLVVGGPLVAIVVLSLIGLSTSTLMLAGILVVGGLGGAAFHPPTAAMVHRLSGERRGLGMALHISAGSTGIAFGPLLAAPLIGRLGLAWTPILAVPSLCLAALLIPRVPRIDPGHERSGGSGLAVLRPYASPLGRLYVIIALRTLVWLSFLTFLPVLLTARGESVGLAGVTIALFLASAGIGGFFGGVIADRHGPKPVIIGTLVMALPFLLLLPRATGWSFFVALALAGFLLQSTLPVTVTFGQSLAPVRAATVSSLMMGFAWGTGGLLVPLVGFLADRIGIAPTLTMVTVVLPAAVLLALTLPRGFGGTPAPAGGEAVPA